MKEDIWALSGRMSDVVWLGITREWSEGRRRHSKWIKTITHTPTHRSRRLKKRQRHKIMKSSKPLQNTKTPSKTRHALIDSWARNILTCSIYWTILHFYFSLSRFAPHISICTPVLRSAQLSSARFCAHTRVHPLSIWYFRSWFGMHL